MTRKGKGRASEGHAQEHFPDTESHGNTPKQSFEQYGRYMVSRLSRIIEGDIIPRLMLALDSPNSISKDESISDRLRDNVDEFVHLVIAHDASVAVRYVSTLRTDGIPLSALYLDLLAPAARKLGELWEDDRCSFTDVTMAVMLSTLRCMIMGSEKALAENVTAAKTEPTAEPKPRYMTQSFMLGLPSVGKNTLTMTAARDHTRKMTSRASANTISLPK